MTSNNPSQLPFYLLSFAAGAAVAILVKEALLPRKGNRPSVEDEDRTNAGATVEGNDLSLFYGDRGQLTTITPPRRFLPRDVYATLVRDTVVCCVDIVLVRTTTTTTTASSVSSGDEHGAPATTRRECLLVERSSEPVRGAWWWPGGRLLKGETFFAAAVRKAQEETGVNAEHVRPVQVLGVWNTFFPTSAWDDEASRGTQTVNPVVLVEIATSHGNVEIKLDGTSDGYRWIPLDPELAAHEDPYVQQALRRLRAWNPDYK